MCNSRHITIRVICSICSAMVPWTFGAQAAGLPPDPDNAALLYYQAMLGRPKPDEATDRLISMILHGDKPNEKSREYLGLCRETIELTKAATQIQQCNWGLIYSQGQSLSVAAIGQLRQLGFLLELDARTLADDREYRKALEACLGLRRFASHIGDDTFITYAVGLASHTNVAVCIKDVLGCMPPDTDTLTWLQGELATAQMLPHPPAKATEIYRDLDLQYVRTHPKSLAARREELSDTIQDESVRNKILSMTDEELIERVRESSDKFLGCVRQILGADILYEQKCARLRELTDRVGEGQGSTDPAVRISNYLHATVYYNLAVQHASFLNAVRAAIEIYLAVAKTGHLPQTLPDGLPKDPYSGKDFEYEITKDGFTLRCCVKPINESRVRQFAFKVAK